MYRCCVDNLGEMAHRCPHVMCSVPFVHISVIGLSWVDFMCVSVVCIISCSMGEVIVINGNGTCAQDANIT